MERSFRLAILFFILFGVVDSILTYLGVSFLGLKEANILMARLISAGWAFFFLFKIIFYSFLSYIAMCVDKEGLIGYGLTISGMMLVTWNIAHILTSVA